MIITGKVIQRDYSSYEFDYCELKDGALEFYHEENFQTYPILKFDDKDYLIKAHTLLEKYRKTDNEFYKKICDKIIRIQEKE